MKLQKKTLAVTTAVFVVAGGSAFAAWTVGTSGVGTTTTGKVEQIKLQMTGNPLQDKWPGEPASISVQYMNPNHRDISGRKITATVASTSSTSCPVESFTVTPPADNAEIKADTGPISGWWGTQTWSDPLPAAQSPSITINQNAPDSCQNVSVTLNFGLS